MKAGDLLKERIFNVPNTISVVRVLLLIPFFWINRNYLNNPSLENYLMVVLFIALAVLTDFLDGFLARHLHQETLIGRYMDAIFDRVVCDTAMVLLLIYYSFPLWIFIYFIGREISSIAVGSFLFFKRDYLPNANMWGKFGVGAVAIVVLWYISVPILKTVLPLDHILLDPTPSAYLLVFIMTGGILAYLRRYIPIMLRKSS